MVKNRVSYMIKRLLKLPKTHSFFLFGARNTGKSSLVKAEFDIKNPLILDRKYSALFEIPVAVYGVGFYFILLFMNINFESHKTIRKIFPFWILWGILFSTYLTYLELFIIKAICMWCVISFANIITIYAVYLLRPQGIPTQIPHS